MSKYLISQYNNDLSFLNSHKLSIARNYTKEANEARELIEFAVPKIEKRLRSLNSKINISIANHNSEKEPNGFVSKEIFFYDLQNEISSGVAYSLNSFKNNYRLGANSLDTINCIHLDIDNDTENILKLDEAKELLKGIKSAIITTKSHQKNKGDHPPEDRFRIFIPVSCEIKPTNCTYADIVSSIVKLLGISEYVDLGASKDLSRFYYASPKDSLAWFSASNRLINWKAFDIEKKTNKTSKPFVDSENRQMYHNELLSTHILESKDGDVEFKSFEGLGQNETKPIRCPQKENHKNGDKNPSAFVSRHNISGKLKIECSNGACKTLFIKY